MASNPMQRKARNSFLLGMLLMLVISGAIIALVFMQLINLQKENKQRESSKATVYVLKQDVKSGQVITNDMLTTLSVEKAMIPNNATSNIEVFNNYALQDKEGNSITTTYNNNDVKMRIRKDNKDYEVKTEDSTGELYIEKNGDKEFLELTTVPLVAKVDMNANTVLTTNLISKSDNTVQDDVRRQEYNILMLPVDLATGDYVDVRLMLPSGQDYIVVSKKEVEIPFVDGEDSQDTVWMDMSEDEILHLNCAIYDAYRIVGAKLYVTKYTEPGMQEASTVTYPVNGSTKELIDNNPNIVEKDQN